jgi:hypothetical protein
MVEVGKASTSSFRSASPAAHATCQDRSTCLFGGVTRGVSPEVMVRHSAVLPALSQKLLCFGLGSLNGSWTHCQYASWCAFGLPVTLTAMQSGLKRIWALDEGFLFLLLSQ